MISGELGEKLEDYVASLVASGRYGSESDVLREGIRLVQEREFQLAALDDSIVRGVADSAADRGTDADEVFERLSLRYRTRISEAG